MTARYKANLPAWIVFGGLSGALWMVVWADSLHGFHLAVWLAALSLSGFAFVWLLSFRIVITPTEICFQSLFRGRQSIPLDQIQKVQLISTTRRRRRHRRPWQLIIEPRTSGGRELSINVKVFSKAAVNAVLDLGTRVGNAT